MKNQQPNGDDMGSGIAAYLGKIILRILLIGVAIGLAIGAMLRN